MSTFYQSPVSGNHPDLNDRDLADQHPISAITGLTDALEQAIVDATTAANTYTDNEIGGHNTDEDAHADIRQKITDDIGTHNTDEDAHADIRQKITDDIGTHNTDEDAHPDIQASIPTQIGEHDENENAHADIRQEIDDAMAIAQGASIAKVFDTYDGTDATALVWWLENEAVLEDIRIGQDFFIKDLGVPDYWWTGNWAAGDPETGLAVLSNQQITMDVYYTKSQIDTLLAAKATVSALNALIEVVDGKADQSALTSLSTTVGNKVDKVSGKGLSTNDYTDADKGKIDLLETAGDGDLFLSDDGTYKAVSGGGSGGTSDHSALSNRDEDDQHPISAITDLADTLDGKAIKRNVVSSASTSATISNPNANTTYLFSNPLTSLTIDGTIPVSDDEILIQFKSASTPTTLTVPSGIKAITSIPTIEASVWYEISIRNNIWAFSQGLDE